MNCPASGETVNDTLNIVINNIMMLNSSLLKEIALLTVRAKLLHSLLPHLLWCGQKWRVQEKVTAFLPSPELPPGQSLPPGHRDSEQLCKS